MNTTGQQSIDSGVQPKHGAAMQPHDSGVQSHDNGVQLHDVATYEAHDGNMVVY